MAAITASQCYRFKLLHILEVAGQKVLTYTLLCGMLFKASTQTLEEYLKNLPPSSTANYTKEKDKAKCFNSTDRTQIVNDLSCTTFDITLLHKAIKLACENVAGKNDNKWTPAAPQPWDLEYFVTKIKNIRNEIVHEHSHLDEPAFLNRVAELSHIFVSTLEATKDRYGRHDAEYIAKKDETLDNVKSIREENLGKEEILQRSAMNMLPRLKMETDRELRCRLDSARYFHPLHFLSGFQNQKVDVNDIFCDILLAEEKMTTHQGETNEFPYLEVLRLCEDTGVAPSTGVGQTGPHVLVVEGEAGSGKTTLATFLLAQWLKPQCDRRVQGLQHYDQLLWVVCRDRISSSLKSFVEVLLPESYTSYGHLLLPLLRQCRILVLIDGLDEKNDLSSQLVEDILGEAANTTFTILCTSRPESVQDMKNSAQQANFQISHVKMLGLTQQERTELVVRHYSWLTRGTNTTHNIAGLRRLMQHIGSRELFRLPLNLLFLSTLYFYEPDKVSTTITQSKLYQLIHKWCEEKLQGRLGGPSNVGQARVFRQGGIARVLRVMYEVALKGLLQNRVYLSDEDLTAVQDACTKESLKPEEMLAAFYCLRREVSFGVVTESYCIPHKGLQDFYAAKHIAGQLSHYKEGAIERMVLACTPNQDPCFRQLRNMLSHLLGLLTRHTGTTAPAMEEVVDLLHRSGVKKTDQWLFMLADAEAPDAAVRRAVQTLKIFPEDEIIYILDGTVTAASLLLPRLPKRKVRVHLTREPASVDDLVQGLACHTVRHLNLVHHFRHPQHHAASAHLLRYVPRNDLWIFIGHLDGDHLKLLPQCLQALYLVVAGNDHARNLLPAVAKALPFLQDLQTIKLHVPVPAVTPSALTRLPAVDANVSLALSGVTEQLKEVAWKIVAAICPPKLSALEFPDATLEVQGWQDMFMALRGASVTTRIGMLVIPDAQVTKEDAEHLNSITTDVLGCTLHRRNEKFMWP